MFYDDLQKESLHGWVQDLVCNSCFIKTHFLPAGAAPHLLHGQNARDDTGFFSTAHIGMSIQHGPHKSGAAARNATDKYKRHVFIVDEGGAEVLAGAQGGAQAAHQRLDALLYPVVALHGVPTQVEDRDGANDQAGHQ